MKPQGTGVWRKNGRRHTRRAGEPSYYTPALRSTRVTFSGSGYGQGRTAGQRANIGGTGIGHNRKALN
jgi:hypothetical protein